MAAYRLFCPFAKQYSFNIAGVTLAVKAAGERLKFSCKDAYLDCIRDHATIESLVDTSSQDDGVSYTNHVVIPCKPKFHKKSLENWFKKHQEASKK
jgi:hypothetical protein